VLPSFVITLREGVEASLIVGIVAAFLVRQGREDALRPMWAGVGLALGFCAAVAVGLRIAGQELPERGQEGLETVVSLIAVGFVSYMIVWMRRHARGLRGVLEGEAATALATGSAIGLVTMAGLARRRSSCWRCSRTPPIRVRQGQARCWGWLRHSRSAWRYIAAA
jgi:high-affinity iron transporter